MASHSFGEQEEHIHRLLGYAPIFNPYNLRNPWRLTLRTNLNGFQGTHRRGYDHMYCGRPACSGESLRPLGAIIFDRTMEDRTILKE